eukprot:scaffold124397_cov15-Tisochrysis_lutea.AAC.2
MRHLWREETMLLASKHNCDAYQRLLDRVCPCFLLKRQLAVPGIYEQLKADAYRLQQQHRGSAAKGRHRTKGGTEARRSGQPEWQLVDITSAEIVDAADAW